jgi:transcription elongation factor Elf1
VPNSQAEAFDCPNCNSRYKLVRAEADPESPDGQVACRQCGAPLNGREGHLVLKYFLVDKPRRQATVRELSRSAQIAE